MTIISILVAGALGFALGCKYKDCLCKKTSNQETQEIISMPVEIQAPIHAHEPSGFSLKKLANLFSKFKTPLNSANSFALLLDAIEEQSYVEILKQIASKADSPKSLYDFFNQESYNPMSYEIQKAYGQPEISDAQLDAILSQNKINAHELKDSTQKVEFLLTLYQGKGVKRFQESFGNDLSQFLNRYSSNENVQPLYESIISTVKRRLQFLS